MKMDSARMQTAFEMKEKKIGTFFGILKKIRERIYRYHLDLLKFSNRVQGDESGCISLPYLISLIMS